MQCSYCHSVPVQRSQVDLGKTRLVIVFRTGVERRFIADSGRACVNLSPRAPRTITFGGEIPGLLEGQSYSREQLWVSGAHCMQQRGISGRQETGCDAIIVSGLRRDGLGGDDLDELWYAAESSKGALAIVTSYYKQIPVRVFRTSAYRERFRALMVGRSARYRYDGVYTVTRYDNPVGNDEPYRFGFQRQGGPSNSITGTTYVAHCERLGTMLPSSERCFLVWWDRRDLLEMDDDRDTIYALIHFGGGKEKVTFKSSRCGELVASFLVSGMEGVIASFDELFKI
jgi:hypothetical protein